ncbi:MAG: hypothetical protein EXS06_11790 [Planctomycetaceae bacterium]|nr:hypothetical protein [Planctomycetaceae bacterium]
MKRLRTDGNLRAIVTMLMLVMWPSQALEGRQLSPPPGSRTPANCEAERDDAYAKAKREYLNALAIVDLKKQTAVDKCKGTFRNDSLDCTRKYNASLKALMAGIAGATLGCGAVCVLVATPAGAIVAPGCATCIAGLYGAALGGVVKAECDLTVCVKGVTDRASECNSGVQSDEIIAKVEAEMAYDEKLRTAYELFLRCKANAGG